MGFTVLVLPNGQVVPGMIPGGPTRAKTQETAFRYAMKNQRVCMNADKAFKECFGHFPDEVDISPEVRLAILERFFAGE